MPAQAQAIQPPAIRPTVREATPQDGDDCGRIFYDAFESIATRHNLPDRAVLTRVHALHGR